MGTWGSGNFESDPAREYLSSFLDGLVAEIAEAMDGDPVAIEADEYEGVVVPCRLELLHVLIRAGHTSDTPLRPELVRHWKQRYLAVWERTIDELEPAPGFKEERRAVLNRTFDQLAEAAAERLT
ncbi:DUF4259 domain-containing protein [Streptomyces sp. XM4011]|uniref:DUF4259 domain-containing protein n=2 Tax=Streptomyces TaxID=1883 RepID=A0A1I6PH82_9ACTN|nr:MULTISPECIES: DUF4259 domain-containing protein [Streptomyces]MCK1814368.1 DUF4259 domain-containing protein [Streptomyces sp. XM4011]SFS39581.1 hypothetical protein SAMN05444716_101507 [Streptomyces harbinensis]